MPDREEKTSDHCERCDRETRHLIKQTEPDNSVRYVCWSCLSREEKGVNLSETWKRQGRGRSGRT